MSVRIAWVVALLGSALLLLACQPEDERPGLWLEGEDAEEQVGD